MSKNKSLSFYAFALIAFLGLIVALSSCSHRQARPVTGMIGRQCEPRPRVVQCSTTLRVEDCEMVREEIVLINKAAGRILYSFDGDLPCGWKDSNCMTTAIGEERILVVLALPELQRLRHDGFPQTVAETRMMVDESNGCIGPSFIVILVDPRDQSYAERRLTFRHELLHGLGVPHSMWSKSDSVMRPASNECNEIPPFAEADLNALRAIYGEW